MIFFSLNTADKQGSCMMPWNIEEMLLTELEYHGENSIPVIKS
jgi:hypothetical protein